MNDSQVSITATLAWTFWALSGVLLATAWAASESVNTTTALCSLAIILAAAAATLHTRSFFCRFTVRIIESYEMGRDRGRAEEREGRKVPLQRV